MSHGNGFSFSGSGKNLSFNLSIDTTKGDFMVIDNGAGFTSASGTISATAEGKVSDEAGKLYAHGTTTCIIFRP